MEKCYFEVYYHAVFAVKNKNALLEKAIRSRVFEYIAGVLRKHKCTVLAVNGSDDHVHIFFAPTPDILLSKLMQAVKGRSSSWINAERICNNHFNWQSGYIAVTHSKSDIDQLVKYLINQEEFHRTTSFCDEFIAMLKENEIEYDERYVFQPPS